MRLHLQQPDQFFEFLGQAREMPPDQIAHLASIIAYVLIGCGILILLRPSTFVLLPIILYQAATPFGAILLDAGPLEKLEPALQLTRSITPLALLLVDFWPPRIKPSLVLCLAATALLRLAIAVTFLAQGVVLLDQCQRGGDFVTLMQLIAQNGFQQTFTEETAQRALGLWGAVLFGLAFSLFSSRNRGVLFLSAIAGLLTAFSFTLADGPTGWPQSLMRISLAGAPLAIFVFQTTSMREQKPVYLAETQTPGESRPTGPEKNR